MDETSLPPPPPTSAPERCYRHPNVETGVHCTRCGRPICPECMIPAPVGHQCPECVGEARREFRQGPGRRIAVANIRRRASATTALLGLIAAVFLLEVVTGGPGSLMTGPSGLKLIELGASVALARLPNGDLVGIAAGQDWRLVSAMFLHAGLLHIAFNAYALWIFGTVVEQELGRLRFLLIYFATGIVASAASYAFGPNAVGVGASGAIFGIFGAFVTYNYRRRHLAIAAARLRSAVMIVVINMVLALSIQGIDWRAHVGGFIAGLFAGFVAEGVGTPPARRTILLVGFVGLLAVAFGLVAWHTSELQSRFGPF
ncbi:MAG: rhomboid family intramembrane serine protease [Actinomycetota bacterium]